LNKFIEDRKPDSYSRKIGDRIETMLRELEEGSFFDPDKHERHLEVP
jgi:hypothetical protein